MSRNSRRPDRAGWGRGDHHSQILNAITVKVYNRDGTKLISDLNV